MYLSQTQHHAHQDLTIEVLQKTNQTRQMKKMCLNCAVTDEQSVSKSEILDTTLSSASKRRTETTLVVRRSARASKSIPLDDMAIQLITKQQE